MNAREFYDAVVQLRDAQKRFNDLADDECMADVLRLEAIIDNEINRVNKILKQNEKEIDNNKTQKKDV